MRHVIISHPNSPTVIFIPRIGTILVRSHSLAASIYKVGLGLVETNVHIQWNPAHQAFHRILFFLEAVC